MGVSSKRVWKNVFILLLPECCIFPGVYVGVTWCQANIREFPSVHIGKWTQLLSMSIRDAYVSERKFRSYTSESITLENKHGCIRSDQRSTKSMCCFWNWPTANDWQKVTPGQDGTKFSWSILISTTDLQFRNLLNQSWCLCKGSPCAVHCYE